MLALLPTVFLIAAFATSAWVIFANVRRLDLALLTQGDVASDVEYRLRGIGVVPVSVSMVRRRRPVTVRWSAAQRSVERAAA